MRRYLALIALASAAVPAVALGSPSAPGDGTLTVRNADGVVRLTLRGAILGKLGGGRLEVIDPDVACDQLSVWGEEDATEREREARDGGKQVACVFKGKAIRFRLIGGQHELRIAGRGIWVSAVGVGRVFLRGSARRDPDGTFSINGERFASLPEDGDSFKIGATPALP